MASKAVQKPGLYNSLPVRYKGQDYRKNSDDSGLYPGHVALGLSIPRGYPEPKVGDKVALLIVDMEDKFLKYHSPEDKTRLIENQAELLGYCCELDIPVVEIVYGREAKTNDRIQALIEKVPHSEFLRKDGNSCFSNPDLDRTLKGWSIDIPIVSGINTPDCILATVDGGIRRGYRMATSADLVSKSRRLADKGSMGKLREECYFGESYQNLIHLFS